MKQMNHGKKVLFIVGTCIVLIGIMLVSLKLGSVEVTYKELILGLLNHETSGNVAIIRDLRMPRVFVAMLVGANLAVSGVLLQAVIRNPLADPYITGISSGAGVVTVFMMVFMPQVTLSRPIFGFLGGVFACLLVYVMSYKRGLSPIRIVLAGAACNALLGGISSMLSMSAGMGSGNIQKWLMGSLATVTWNHVYILVVYSLIGLVLAMFLSKVCNILVLGSKNVKSLGMNANLCLILVTAVAVFLGSISAAIAGMISFVGLVVPHICRLIVGSNHTYLIPCSAVLGACLVLISDTIGRLIMHPYEVPVGIVTCIIGAPFFLYLLRKSDLK